MLYVGEKLIYSFFKCVIGGTGSGKTTRIILPELLALIHAQKSLVIQDPKSEIPIRKLHPKEPAFDFSKLVVF